MPKHYQLQNGSVRILKYYIKAITGLENHVEKSNIYDFNYINLYNKSLFNNYFVKLTNNLERLRSACLSTSSTPSLPSFLIFLGLAFICWSMFFWTGTGILGNNVENHSSLVRKERSISPMVMTQPPPAFTSRSLKRTNKKQNTDSDCEKPSKICFKTNAKNWLPPFKVQIGWLSCFCW